MAEVLPIDRHQRNLVTLWKPTLISHGFVSIRKYGGLSSMLFIFKNTKNIWPSARMSKEYLFELPSNEFSQSCSLLTRNSQFALALSLLKVASSRSAAFVPLGSVNLVIVGEVAPGVQLKLKSHSARVDYYARGIHYRHRPLLNSRCEQLAAINWPRSTRRCQPAPSTRRDHLPRSTRRCQLAATNLRQFAAINSPRATHHDQLGAVNSPRQLAAVDSLRLSAVVNSPLSTRRG